MRNELLNFEEALVYVKDGKFISRQVWNGEFVYQVKSTIVNGEDFRNEAREAVLQAYRQEGNTTNQESKRIINSRLDKKEYNGTLTCGWTPTTADLFARDWYVII